MSQFHCTQKAVRECVVLRTKFILWWASLLIAMAVGLICGKGSFAFEVNPEEVPVTPIAAPLYEKKPIRLRDCKFTAAFFATSSDLTGFVPDELALIEPPAAPGTTLMIAFGGKCPRTTLGPCAFTLVLAPVKLNIPGHPHDGQLVGMYPIHPFVSNENFYKICDLLGGCPLKLASVKRRGSRKVKVVLKRLDIRPINADGELDLEGEAPKKATKLVKLMVTSESPLTDATLEQFEQATGLPFRNSEGKVAFIFPPLVNFKVIPRVDGSGLDVAQLTQVPFQEQVVTNVMSGPGELSLASSPTTPIGDQIKVDAVFGGVNFDFDFEFGWPAGVVLHDYLAP